MQRFVFIPTVATFGCLFHGVQVLCAKCQNTLQLFLMSFSIWCLSIIIDGHASSDQLLGPMLIKVHCFSCLGLIWVFWMRCHHIGSLCCVCGTWFMHHVRVVFSVFSVFCYVEMREKIIIIVLSQHPVLYASLNIVLLPHGFSLVLILTVSSDLVSPRHL